MDSYRRWGLSNHDTEDVEKPTLIGQSPAITDLKKKAILVADSEVPVLITGENGSGKEVLANVIHYHSKRRAKPLVTVNCGAIPNTLVESELFGHEKGAFTGADKSRKGCFEQADGGTLFLDEIAEMTLSSQVKLLRAVELKAFRKIGGRQEINVDIRVISATNKRLTDQIRSGSFREDLFYRLNVIELYMPPLRHRKEDIPLFIDHFLDQFTKKYDVLDKHFSNSCMEIFLTYDWPGNVRELKNIIERSVVMSENEVMDIDTLPVHLQEVEIEDNLKRDPIQDFNQFIHIPVGLTIQEIEQKVIGQTLAMVDNNKTKAAKLLGFSRKTLHNKLEKYKDESCDPVSPK